MVLPLIIVQVVVCHLAIKRICYGVRSVVKGASETTSRRVFLAPTARSSPPAASTVTDDVITTVTGDVTASTTANYPDPCSTSLDAISVIRGQLVAFKSNVRCHSRWLRLLPDLQKLAPWPRVLHGYDTWTTIHCSVKLWFLGFCPWPWHYKLYWVWFPSLLNFSN